jgi:hypothetical protein
VIEADESLLELIACVVVETSEEDGEDGWEILLDRRSVMISPRFWNSTSKTYASQEVITASRTSNEYSSVFVFPAMSL